MLRLIRQHGEVLIDNARAGDISSKDMLEIDCLLLTGDLASRHLSIIRQCPSIPTIPLRSTYATATNQHNTILIGCSACNPPTQPTARGFTPLAAQARTETTNVAFKPRNPSTAAA